MNWKLNDKSVVKEDFKVGDYFNTFAGIRLICSDKKNKFFTINEEGFLMAERETLEGLIKYYKESDGEDFYKVEPYKINNLGNIIFRRGTK